MFEFTMSSNSIRIDIGKHIIKVVLRSQVCRMEITSEGKHHLVSCEISKLSPLESALLALCCEYNSCMKQKLMTPRSVLCLAKINDIVEEIIDGYCECKLCGKWH